MSKLPPEAIEEVPPEQRPEGDNVAWIPGYTAWDDERGDFLWVSGIWCVPHRVASGCPGTGRKVANGVSVDFGILGRCHTDRDSVSARAARDRRSRAQHCRTVVGLQMVARLLDLATESLRLASGLLGTDAAGTGTGFPLTTSVHLEAMSSWMATMITQWPGAESCSLRCISMRASTRDKGIPIRRLQ